MFHASMSCLSRSGGRSAAGACAYVSASETRDTYGEQRAFNYTRKTAPVAVSYHGTTNTTPASFAAALDGAETRKNSTVAREAIVALPHELTDAQRKATMDEIAAAMSERWGVPVMAALHRPDRGGDQRNDHAHFIIGTRDRVGKKTRILDDQKTGRGEVEWFRSMVSETICKRPVIDAGAWDFRSYEKRGIDAVPGVHEGPQETAMRRKGIYHDAAKFNNQLRADIERAENLSKKLYADIANTTTEQNERLKAQRIRAQMLWPWPVDRPTGNFHNAKRSAHAGRR